MSTPRDGRPAIFRPKKGGARVQGLLTRTGARAFEGHRKALAELAGRGVDQVSDADVIEYLARGAADTSRVLEA